MYQAYWGLGRAPFRGNLDPTTFHQGPTQEEALARLHFLVDERRTLGLLLGESGTGKSLLLEVFRRELGTIGNQRALISLIGLDRHEFFWQLAGQLGIEVSPRDSLFTLTRATTDHIIANRYQQLTTVLLMDDADEATAEVLTEVIRIAQLTQTSEARVTIALSARPRYLHRLGTRILELAELRVDLDSWELEDTSAFVKCSLAISGRTTPVFTESALRRLQELTGGVPRRIKQIADLALLAGAGANVGLIESETIESVFHELGVVATGSMTSNRR